jgi:CheY-like chemotaxis protein
MAPETLEHLFEPFYTTKQLGKGTGLGLATVYGIVQQSGGDIRVESAPERGSTFSVYFPAIEAPAEAVTTPAESAPPRGRETILLVEDQAEVRQLAARMLRSLGYGVLVATSGAEALQIVQQQRDQITLVLTDVVMPEMSGVELARQLQSDAPQLKTLFMSGYADRALAQYGATEAGMPLITKPFGVADLARKLRQIIES